MVQQCWQSSDGFGVAPVLGSFGDGLPKLTPMKYSQNQCEDYQILAEVLFASSASSFVISVLEGCHFWFWPVL